MRSRPANRGGIAIAASVEFCLEAVLRKTA